MSDTVDLVLRYLHVVIVLGLVLGPLAYVLGRATLRRHRLIEQHRREGTIGPVSIFQNDRLPLDHEVLARLGTAGEAPQTVDDRILRPSPGVRLLAVALAATVAGYLFLPGFAPDGFHEVMRDLPVPPVVVEALFLIAAVNAVLYIFGFEARYNRDLLIVTRMFLHRREYRWRDLRWIGDDGAYDLVLRFDPGGKAKVRKHCRGIAEFRRFAQERLAKQR